MNPDSGRFALVRRSPSFVGGLLLFALSVYGLLCIASAVGCVAESAPAAANRARVVRD